MRYMYNKVDNHKLYLNVEWLKKKLLISESSFYDIMAPDDHFLSSLICLLINLARTLILECNALFHEIIMLRSAKK